MSGIKCLCLLKKQTFDFKNTSIQITISHADLTAIVSGEPGTTGCFLDFPFPFIPIDCASYQLPEQSMIQNFFFIKTRTS